MHRVAAKFVPKLLLCEQKELQLDITQDMLECANGDLDFLKTVITGDESWVYGYDPGTKAQSSQWKSPSSPRPKKARQVRSEVKGMLTFFTTAELCITNTHQKYYQEVLRHVRDAVRRKRPDLWESRNWQWHHDNAPAHSSCLIQDFLAKHGISQIRQAPYFPDMAPCGIWLFPKLKMPLKESLRRARVTHAHTLAAGQRLTHSTRFHGWALGTTATPCWVLPLASNYFLRKKIMSDTFWTDLVCDG
jgi:hypothetical protein